MTATPQAPPARSANRREMFISLALMVVFDIGLNLLVFNQLRAHGASELTAYLCATVGPLVSIVVEFARHRRLSRFSLFIIVINVLSAIVSVVGNTDGRWLIIKDSFFTGGIGLVFLVTLVVGKPLTMSLGEKFATDGTDEGVAWWRGMYDAYPSFRRMQRVITAVWGVAFVVEAAIRVVCALTMSFDAAYNIGQILPLAVTGLCIAFTIGYGMRTKRAGEARARAAAAQA